MTRPKGKSIVLLVGTAVVLVAALATVYWREIYYALRPEARFWGRWKAVEAEDGERSISGIRLTPIIEFRADGDLALQVDALTTMPGANVFLQDSVIIVGWTARYRVARGRVVFLNLSTPPRGTLGSVASGDFDGDGRIDMVVTGLPGGSPKETVTARYRFETQDRLILDWEDGALLGDEKSLTLRRLPEDGDTDE